MQKTYKRRIFKILINLVYGVFAAGLAGYVVGIATDKTLYAGIAAGVIFVLFLFMTLSQFRLSVMIEGDKVVFLTKKGREEYVIDECAFSSRMRGNSDFSLGVTQNDVTKHYDLSFLSYSDYMDLLERLKIVGSNQRAVKIDTQKK